MSANYETGLATSDDIPAIIAMQEPNLHENGGGLCGNGLAGMLYQEMRARLPGSTAMSFVRSDNKPSLRANRKMGKKELGEFRHDGESYIVFAFSS